MIEKKTLTYKDKIIFEKVRMDSYKRIPKLFQNDEACFMFVNEGQFNVRAQDAFMSFGPGDGLLAKCFNYFFETNRNQRKNSPIIEVVGVLLHPSMLPELLHENIVTTTAQGVQDINKVGINKILLNYKEGISILLDNPSLASDALILAKLKEFIILISYATHTSPIESFLSQIFDPVIYQLNKVVENNLYSDLKINDYAFLCNMSIASFNRKFKEFYNVSPKKYIMNKRLQKAKKMLHLKHYRITDIAYECGFETISTFNRAFKKSFNLSPSEYRNKID